MLHAACRCNRMVHLINKLKTKIKIIKNTTMLMLLQCRCRCPLRVQQVRGNLQGFMKHNFVAVWTYVVCM
jgi:hypothetical protein